MICLKKKYGHKKIWFSLGLVLLGLTFIFACQNQSKFGDYYILNSNEDDYIQSLYFYSEESDDNPDRLIIETEDDDFLFKIAYVAMDRYPEVTLTLLDENAIISRRGPFYNKGDTLNAMVRYEQSPYWETEFLTLILTRKPGERVAEDFVMRQDDNEKYLYLRAEQINNSFASQGLSLFFVLVGFLMIPMAIVTIFIMSYGMHIDKYWKRFARFFNSRFFGRNKTLIQGEYQDVPYEIFMVSRGDIATLNRLHAVTEKDEQQTLCKNDQKDYDLFKDIQALEIRNNPYSALDGVVLFLKLKELETLSHRYYLMNKKKLPPRTGMSKHITGTVLDDIINVYEDPIEFSTENQRNAKNTINQFLQSDQSIFLFKSLYNIMHPRFQLILQPEGLYYNEKRFISEKQRMKRFAALIPGLIQFIRIDS